MAPLEIERVGEYYRVCKPEWIDCADTSFAKAHGGRWNPPGEFGALYLNANVNVAAANARRLHVGRAIGLFDLRPDRRPQLAIFTVPRLRVADVVTPEGIEAVGLPTTYPVDADWSACHTVGRAAHAAGLAGVAARSAADRRIDRGEELAVFDSVRLAAQTTRVPFVEWYPDPAPR